LLKWLQSFHNQGPNFQKGLIGKLLFIEIYIVKIYVKEVEQLGF